MGRVRPEERRSATAGRETLVYERRVGYKCLVSRPKLLSDDEVLDATREVIRRRGPAHFTLADVAAEVGLARSTLIQRFQNRDGLYHRVMERGTNRLQSELDALPGGTEPQELWRFLHTLVSVLRSERINEYLLTVVE